MKTSIFRSFGLVLCLFCMGQGLWAQGVDFFSTEPETFIQQFTQALQKERGELGGQAANLLSVAWQEGAFSEDEKAQLIDHVNRMVSKKAQTVPDLAYFAMIFTRIKKQDGYVLLSLPEFLVVNAVSLEKLAPKRLKKFYEGLYNYIGGGFLVKRKSSFWYASQKDPELAFISVEDQEGTYEAPVVRYTSTDLKYYSERHQDSTLISGTQGDFNLLSLTFAGKDGRVTWEKMGLEKDDVYCDFGPYKINLNQSVVKVDTVTFNYKSLMDAPIMGRFEDANMGYRSLEQANYPFFQSSEGGVVIDKLIPNIRYEGGFSLMGTRKVGTSYDIWEDYVPEPSSTEDDPWAVHSTASLLQDEVKNDEWNDDEWEDESNSEASFSSDDSDWGTDDWEYDGATEGEEPVEETYLDESSMLPSQVQRHIKATLAILRKGKPVMALQGEAFALDDQEMISKAVEAVLYTSDKDSIYHPSMDVVYTSSDSSVVLKKPKRGTYKSIPFTSSYHEYFLYFESIKWNLTTDQLEFTAFIDRENKVSAIESYDYFTMHRFRQFKGMLKFNPIGAIHRYKSLNKGQPIYPSSIMEDPVYRRVGDARSLEVALPALEGSGFIRYDRQTKEITPLPKLTKWSLAARKKKDFDAIQIISKVDSGAHAVMNLETMNIEMRGVNFFSLSDSVYLRVVPMEAKVSVQSNRNLQFGGVVACGKINFYSSDEERPSFTFDYDSYKIVCDSIDSVRFVLVRNPPPGYEPTPFEQALSNTVFEGITGAIHIDDPNNKSGEKDYKEYPVFDSYSRSYLYWDKPHIEGGVYVKDKMNFSLDPFVLPSLEELSAENLNFEGEFYSSEIFPTFRQTLQVMEDYTLGFKQQTPEFGYRIYDNRGKFFNEITLDSKGLRGNGQVEYLGTIAKSDSFIFHFDSVMAELKYFNLKRGYRGGVYFPKVEANSALYKWYIKDSTLAVSSTYEAISIFDGQGKFTGTLSISPRGMIGNGEIILGEIRVRGDSIIFEDMDFTAPNADFIIADEEDEEKVHFIAEAVDITYDVFRHKTSFESKEVGKQLAAFPMHNFNTTLGKGAYQRATRDLKIEGVSSYLKDNFFVSTDPSADSLNFKALEAYYQVETQDIKVSGVPYIYVADAVITTETKELMIAEGGKIQPLMDAQIEADRETKLHRIYDATVQLYGRNEYEGSGKYDYIEVNGKKQFVEFNNIKVNSDNTTVASGVIQDSDAFYLTERIAFRGNAQLDASRKFLSFGGEVKIESENPVFKGAWFTFDNTIVNPDSVFIPIAADLTNEGGDELTVGLNFVPENRVFYSNFLQAKEDDDDLEVLSASGGLTFDRKKKEFKIGSEDKIKGRVFKGSTVSFNDAKNTITSQGFLRFPYDFADKTINMKMAGQWKEDLRRRELSSDLVMAIGLPVLPKEQTDKLAEQFSFLTQSNRTIDFRDRTFLESISELLDEGRAGERETGKFIENVNTSLIYTDIKLSQQLPYTILLSGVNFNFSRDHKALYSDADVGLIGLGGNPINKVINSKIVYQFGRINALGEKENDELTIYLEVDEFNWVYFHFEDQVLKTFSTFYDDYNYPLKAEIDKQKSAEGFRIELATEDEIAKFRQDYVLKFIKD